MVGPITALPHDGDRQIFRVYSAVHARELLQQINEENIPSFSLKISLFPVFCTFIIKSLFSLNMMVSYASTETLELPLNEHRLLTSHFHSKNLKWSEKKHGKYTCYKTAIVWNVTDFSH